MVRLDGNISALEKKGKEQSDLAMGLAMETAKKIVEQLQLAMDRVEGKSLTFKTRLTELYVLITKP